MNNRYVVWGTGQKGLNAYARLIVKGEILFFIDQKIRIGEKGVFCGLDVYNPDKVLEAETRKREPEGGI